MSTVFLPVWSRLLLAGCVFLVADACAARLSSLADVQIVDEAGIGVSLVSDAANAIVIVIDAHRDNSMVLLNTLKSAGFDGEHSTIVITGQQQSASAFAKQQAMLPKARWVSAGNAALNALMLSGTPVVLGIDAQQQIVWQQTGLPRQPGDLPVRIVDWINTPVAAPVSTSADVEIKDRDANE